MSKPINPPPRMLLLSRADDAAAKIARMLDAAPEGVAIDNGCVVLTPVTSTPRSDYVSVYPADRGSNFFLMAPTAEELAEAAGALLGAAFFLADRQAQGTAESVGRRTAMQAFAGAAALDIPCPPSGGYGEQKL